MAGNRLIIRGLKYIASHTNAGRKILDGIRVGKLCKRISFAGLKGNMMESIWGYGRNVVKQAPEIVQTAKNRVSEEVRRQAPKIVNEVKNNITDAEYLKALGQFAKRYKMSAEELLRMPKDELLQLVMSKSGVGPCKFAQIISSEESIMSKLSPKLQEVIKKTQSSNFFTRTLAEAQSEVNRAFGKKQAQFLLRAPGASGILPEVANADIKLVKALSAGTVGETYLARDMKTGKEYIVKMIKKGVNAEQLQMEENLFTGFIHRFAPDAATEAQHTNYIRNLYKDWGKELDFACEYDYNKLLQQGAKRYKVADIVRMSEDKTCILMKKADGIQMNKLMEILKDYKTSPVGFAEKYKDLIAENPWLANPDKVIKELPVSMAKSFDEMFLFMKKGGKSVMHGDPHMGNYFITAGKDGKLVPVFIDTGNCVVRDAKQIQNDLKFFADYAVGNSRGIAEYFYRQCDVDVARLASRSQQRLASSCATQDEMIINAISQDIHRYIFGKNHNVSDVGDVMRTIRVIMEKNGLNMRPETITALKAQLQFTSNISEVASLSGGNSALTGTIIRDIPQAIVNMAKNRMNPIKPFKGSLKFARNNKELSSNCLYQFLSEPTDAGISLVNPTECFDDVLRLSSPHRELSVVW